MKYLQKFICNAFKSIKDTTLSIDNSFTRKTTCPINYWAMLITYIIKNYDTNKIKVYQLEICGRCTIIVYDKDSRTLSCIINYNQFKRVRKYKHFPKYIQLCLNYFNNRKVQSYMFDDLDFNAKEEALKNVPLSYLDNDTINNTDYFNLIVYWQKEYELLSLKNYTLDFSTLDIINYENWFNDIIPDISEIDDSSEPDDTPPKPQPKLKKSAYSLKEKKKKETE